MLFYKISYYPEPDSHSRNKIKIELYLCNCAIKLDVKKQRVFVGTSEFVNKFQLASIKSKVDKANVDKLETVLTNLSKLSNRI